LGVVHYAVVFRWRPFFQPPFFPARLIFFGSRALDAPRPRAPMIEADAFITKSSGISASQFGHFTIIARYPNGRDIVKIKKFL
jgi:hypothetical protein